jgi:hypothetical protein
LKYLVNQSRNNRGGGAATAVLACIASCICKSIDIRDSFLVSCIQGIIEYINSYAFAHVAIYGKSYCEAGKDVFNLFSSTGIQMIINDSLVDNVLGFGCFGVGFISAAVAAIAAFLFLVNSIQFAIISAILIFIAVFIIGYFMMVIVAQVVLAGTKALFVCVAEDPAALQRTKPELYQKLVETYPTVQWRV